VQPRTANALVATTLAQPLFSPTRWPPETAKSDASLDPTLNDVRLTGIVTEPDRRRKAAHPLGGRGAERLEARQHLARGSVTEWSQRHQDAKAESRYDACASGTRSYAARTAPARWHGNGTAPGCRPALGVECPSLPPSSAGQRHSPKLSRRLLRYASVRRHSRRHGRGSPLVPSVPGGPVPAQLPVAASPTNQGR